ncbi:MAG: hypothetical protein HRT77_05180 [Halioglobus sp.]|nr:hypothetical protein [Halioglobus sp.]
MKRCYLLALTLIVTSCTAPLEPIEGCKPRGDIRPVCHMQTPEDIAAAPDGRHLVLAHFGNMGESIGSISLFDTRNDSLRVLYPTSDPDSNGFSDWGEASCSNPPGESIGPHGTHLHRLEDGRWRYLVVNHGEREAIELFELLPAGTDTQLIWRGCVIAGPDTLMNDVVGLTNGDIIYTRMFNPSDSLAVAKSALGIATGELWRWNAKKGLEPLPTTRAAQPNGLEIDVTNEHVYANMYMEKEVWQVRLSDGEVTARYSIPNADNSAWGSDGRLWVTTHDMGIRDLLACFGNSEAPCPGAFNIIALDPTSGHFENVFHHEGPPMGAATIAVPQGGRVYMGSFVGDRLISVPDFITPDIPTAKEQLQKSVPGN